MISAIRQPAEEMVQALKERHLRIAIDLDRDDSRAPVWYAHLPGGNIFPIRLIGTRGPFVRFTGFGATTDKCDYVLMAPERVVVSIKSATGGEQPFEGFPEVSDDEDVSDQLPTPSSD